MIIGLSGYARSGKDEVAKVLVEQHGFRRVAFADKLRDVLYALNPVVDMAGQEWAYETFDVGPDTPGEHVGGITPITVQMVINQVGWDGYKETKYGPEIRRLLQRLGTEAGRETLWDSIWVDAAFADVKDDENIVVTDMRFPNEYDAVVQRSGYVWRVIRPGVGKANDHPSETSLDTYVFNRIVVNSGTLNELAEKVTDCYHSPAHGREQ